MLSPSLETLIDLRLDDVLSGRVSRRALARDLGISRTTLAVILSGQRPIDRSRRLAARQPRPRGRGPLPRNLVRCPGCGGSKVEMPCIVCRDRAELARRPPRPEPWAPSPEPLTVALLDEDAERYLQLQARRAILREAEQLAEEDPLGELEPSDAELIAAGAWAVKKLRAIEADHQSQDL